MQLELCRISEEDLSLRYAVVAWPRFDALSHLTLITTFHASELSENRIYSELLKLSPGLEERINTGSEQDLHYVADMVSFFANNARASRTLSDV